MTVPDEGTVPCSCAPPGAGGCAGAAPPAGGAAPCGGAAGGEGPGGRAPPRRGLPAARELRALASPALHAVMSRTAPVTPSATRAGPPSPPPGGPVLLGPP